MRHSGGNKRRAGDRIIEERTGEDKRYAGPSMYRKMYRKARCAKVCDVEQTTFVQCCAWEVEWSGGYVRKGQHPMCLRILCMTLWKNNLCVEVRDWWVVGDVSDISLALVILYFPFVLCWCVCPTEYAREREVINVCPHACFLRAY